MNLGIGEIMVILVIAFVVVGPKDLPKIARTLAKGIRQIKGFYGDIKRSLSLEEELTGIKKTVEEISPKESHDVDISNIKKEIDRLRSEKIL